MSDSKSFLMANQPLEVGSGWRRGAARVALPGRGANALRGNVRTLAPLRGW
jgi:hypothetical protein